MKLGPALRYLAPSPSCQIKAHLRCRCRRLLRSQYPGACQLGLQSRWRDDGGYAAQSAHKGHARGLPAERPPSPRPIPSRHDPGPRLGVIWGRMGLGPTSALPLVVVVQEPAAGALCCCTDTQPTPVSRWRSRGACPQGQVGSGVLLARGY